MGTLRVGLRAKALYALTDKWSRSFSMSSSRLEKALENLEKNPYFEKYAGRIAELQKTSPEEFLRRVECVTPKKPESGEAPDLRQYSSVLNPKAAVKNKEAAEDKKLESIFKVDLVKDKKAQEICGIWEEYHKNKEVISATIPCKIYDIIVKNMRQNPTFLFPLPRSQGYEFVLSQILGHTVHFTPLLAYQVHKENAPECLTMVHYTELLDKGIILMRGEYDKNVLTGQEAKCLANQFQMYYNSKDQAKSDLLQLFTSSPNSFKHMELIKELENISLV